MSIFNGTVEATSSRSFNTYQEADEFIAQISVIYGPDSFEGMQVRDGKYIVNYNDPWAN